MGQTDGTVAQTVIAQIVLPTCSIYDHDTFPGYGACSRETTIVVP